MTSSSAAYGSAEVSFDSNKKHSCSSALLQCQQGAVWDGDLCLFVRF